MSHPAKKKRGKGRRGPLSLFAHKRRAPIGARPGVLAVEADTTAPAIHVFRYDEAELEEIPIADPDQLADIRRPGKICWIDVEHVSHGPTLQRFGELFAIHPLALSDVANVPQRIKAESYEGHELIIARMIRLASDDADSQATVHALDSEQVSFIVGDGFVITFQERAGDVFDPVRRRLRDGGRIRRTGADYLAYALLDTIVDGYFPVIESLGDTLENLDAEVLVDPTERLLEKINTIKRTLLVLRRSLWPQREALNRLVRDPVAWIGDDVRLYFRDTHDHCVQMVELVESQREFAAGLLNTWLTVVSNRTNDIMKVLTIVGSIFIPLTFLAGIYGMNFDHIPELHLPWGYPALLGVMVVITIGLLVFFGRKGWLGGSGGRKS